MELTKIFVELLRRYNWYVFESRNLWNNFCAGVFSQSDMRVEVLKRQCKREARGVGKYTMLP